MEAAVILSTYPDRASATKAASALINDRLAACVSFMQVDSTYWWEGKVESADEILAIFKTVGERRDELKKRIARTHPYNVPEVIEVAVQSVNAPYLQWLVKYTL